MKYISGDEAHLILIDCIKERFDFPELKNEALRLYDYLGTRYGNY